MFSLQKFFGKDPIFYDLFDKSAEQILESAKRLEFILQNPQDSSALQPIKDARRRSKEITEQLQELVVKTFVTSLEREDIESLTTSLYKVIKPIEKFAERFRIATPWVKDTDFLGQVKIIVDSAEYVKSMVFLIRRTGNIDAARRLNSALKLAESDADALEVDLLKQLYSNSSADPKRMFIAKDLYNLLEKSIDRCRDVGAVIMHIVLKNS